MAARAGNSTPVFAQEIKIFNAVSRMPRSRRRNQSPVPARSLRLKSSFSKTAYLPLSPPSARRAPPVLSGRTTAARVRPMILASSTSRLPAGATTSDTGIRRTKAVSMTRWRNASTTISRTICTTCARSSVVGRAIRALNADALRISTSRVFEGLARRRGTRVVASSKSGNVIWQTYYFDCWMTIDRGFSSQCVDLNLAALVSLLWFT